MLEFGNSWSGHYRHAEPLIRDALEGRTHLEHIKVADESGKRLGRSFGVKLWPTLIFLKAGKEIARVIRPRDDEVLRKAMDQIENQA